MVRDSRPILSGCFDAFTDNNRAPSRTPRRTPPVPPSEIIVISDSESEAPAVQKPRKARTPSKRPPVIHDDSDDTDMEIQIIGPPQPAKTTDLVPPESTKISLSPEQQGVLNRVMRGDNVFFTGAAGIHNLSGACSVIDASQALGNQSS